MKKAFLLAFLIFAVIIIAGCKPLEKTLTDKDLLDYARSDFNKTQMMFKDIMIGKHNNIPVKVSFPCGDVCPEYTIRIIRYDVNLTNCSQVNGEIKSVLIPAGIAVLPKEFCFPKLLIDNKIYSFVE